MPLIALSANGPLKTATAVPVSRLFSFVVLRVGFFSAAAAAVGATAARVTLSDSLLCSALRAVRRRYTREERKGRRCVPFLPSQNERKKGPDESFGTQKNRRRRRKWAVLVLLYSLPNWGHYLLFFMDRFKKYK